MKNAMILTLSLTLLTLSYAYGATHTFQPDGDTSQDTYIWAQHPSYNYGNSIEMSVGSYPTGKGLFGFIRFDGLNDYLDETITSAELNLYVFLTSGTITDDNYVDIPNDTWDEDTMTYDNAPVPEYAYAIPYGPPSDDSWISIDVTSIVQDWADGTFNHNGFYLAYGGASSCFYSIYSAENSDDSFDPYLVINYDATSIESASMGEIKAAFK